MKGLPFIALLLLLHVMLLLNFKGVVDKYILLKEIQAELIYPYRQG